MTVQIQKLARRFAGVALGGLLSVSAFAACPIAPALCNIVPNTGVVAAADPKNDPTALTGSVQAPQLSITIGGASATDKALGNLVRSLCVDAFNNTTGAAGADNIPDNETAYRNGSSGNNYQAYYCTMDAAQVTGLSGSLRTLIRKRSKDGSGTGAGPVCTALAQDFMKVDSNCTYNSQVGNLSTYNCTDAAADLEAIPQTNAGITDVGPSELFQLASNACDVVAKIYGADFMIVATKQLRDALQCAQGLTVGSETAANMPTLSLQAISSVQTGVIQNWSELSFGALPLVGTVAANARITGCGLTVPASTRATYMRREKSSGTFAANELRVNNKDNGNATCATGNLGSKEFPGTLGTGPIVPPHAPGAGDIDSGMNILDKVGSANPADVQRFACLGKDLAPGTAAGTSADEACNNVAAYDCTQAPNTPPSWFAGTCAQYNTLLTTVNSQMSTWAIGHQTSERNGANGAENTNRYRTVAIDGVVPTLNNVAAGKHDFWVESTGQYLTSNVSADQKALVDQLFANAKKGTEIAAANALNTGSIHSWGQAGIFAIKNTGSNCSLSTAGVSDFNAVTNPCSAFTRSKGGSVTPNCSNGTVVPTGAVIAPISP